LVLGYDFDYLLFTFVLLILITYTKFLFMKQYDAKYGLMAGGIAILISLVVYLIDSHSYLKFGAAIAALPMFYFIVQAALAVKKQNNGFISFGDAFKNSWVTYLIYSLLSTIFMYILFNFIDPDLNEMMKETAVETLEKVRSVLGDEATDEGIKAIEKSTDQNIGNLAFNFLISLIFPGAFLALIIALIVKKEDNPWTEKETL
jgi:Na+-translocating ferredoxin:NAD+ oxidoreductase RnfE subunit